MTHPGDRPDAGATVVEVAGDLDASTLGPLEDRLTAAIALGRPVLVDLGDCTFLDGRGACLLAGAYARATTAGVPYYVVLPYTAASTVRRLLLEFTPDLVSFPIVPHRRSAEAAAGSAVPVGAPVDGRMHALRAGIWEAGSERARLLAERDELILTQRQALAEHRSRSARRREPG
jgi:anti-anti-sigma factor